MCYCDYCNRRGITKYIKGNQMQSGSTDKHSFEFRIHLDQKLLRVASLPWLLFNCGAGWPQQNRIESKLSILPCYC